MSDLYYLSITAAARGIRRKEYSPVELTEACLDRIASLDSRLHSFITETADLALQQARQTERELRSGTDRGPLHGIPVALKDLYMNERDSHHGPFSCAGELGAGLRRDDRGKTFSRGGGALGQVGNA